MQMNREKTVQEPFYSPATVAKRKRTLTAFLLNTRKRKKTHFLGTLVQRRVKTLVKTNQTQARTKSRWDDLYKNVGHNLSNNYEIAYNSAFVTFYVSIQYASGAKQTVLSGIFAEAVKCLALDWPKAACKVLWNSKSRTDIKDILMSNMDLEMHKFCFEWYIAYIKIPLKELPSRSYVKNEYNNIVRNLTEWSAVNYCSWKSWRFVFF